MSERRKEFGLFLFSWACRLLAAIPVVLAGTPLAFDEDAYFDRAAAYCRIAKAILRGAAPLAQDWGAAYHFGVWPPLNSIILAVPMSVFGEREAVARLTLTLVSAATTVLLYRLTKQVASERAALGAALTHAVYPSFVAFAHLLWSETVYIFFLVLAVHLALRLRHQPAPRRRLALALCAGLALGACLATRAAGVPYLLAIPLVVLLRGDAAAADGGRRRFCVRDAAIVAAAAILVVLPWEASLAKRQQRFVALSTANAVNLYLGNNEWNLGADAKGARSKVLATSKRYADEHGIDRDAAAVRLAAAYAARDPAGLASGLVQKVRLMFLPDQFLVRHLLAVVYPPISPRALAVVWLALVVSFVAFAALTVRGIVERAASEDARLLRVFVLVGLVPALITLANTRIALPSLALLCPVVGAALERGQARAGARRGATLAFAAAALVILNVATIHRHPAREIAASAVYAPVVTPLARALGWHAQYTDAFAIRPAVGSGGATGAGAAAVRIALPDSLHTFADGDAMRSEARPGDARESEARSVAARAREWRPESPRSFLSVSVASSLSAPPIALELSTDAPAGLCRVAPLARATWRRWAPTELGTFEIRWNGSGKGVGAGQE